MKLFDILGGKIIIHPDALGIPCFNALWDSVKDKTLATKYISYIVFKNKFDSPYVLSMDSQSISSILKQELFGSSTYELPKEVLDCEAMYIKLTDTLMLKLLRNARNKLESISRYYESSLDDELDEKRVKDILAGMGSLGKTIESIGALEMNVKNEEMSSQKIRGGGKMNDFEIPHK